MPTPQAAPPQAKSINKPHQEQRSQGAGYTEAGRTHEMYGVRGVGPLCRVGAMQVAMTSSPKGRARSERLLGSHTTIRRTRARASAAAPGYDRVAACRCRPGMQVRLLEQVDALGVRNPQLATDVRPTREAAACFGKRVCELVFESVRSCLYEP